MSVRETLKKHKPRLVEVEWNGDKLWVKGMSGADRQDYRNRVTKAEANGGFKNEYAFALAVRDENGVRQYDPDNADDIAEISELDGDLIDRVVLAYLGASGLTKKAVEDAEKNSEAIRS